MDDEEELKTSPRGSSSDDDNLESEWGFIDHAKADERDSHYARPKLQRTAPTTSGQSRFLNMMVNGKNKFFSSFYNIYQGVPSEPAGFGIEDIWCLGKVFKLPSKDVRKGSRQFLHAIQFLEEIEFGFVWFTYRRDFPVLETYGSSSDIGWGCMLRTAQMMLAKVLATLYFGRNWRLTEEDMRNPSSIYREVLRWFLDMPSTADRPRPYSIHSFIHVNTLLHDNTYGQHPMTNLTGGEWFSPTKVAHILEFLVRTHQPNGLVMYVPSDCAIYIDKVLELCNIPAKPPTPAGLKTNDDINPLDPETPLEPSKPGEVRGEDILKTVVPPSTVNPLRRSAGATIETKPHHDDSSDDDFSHERLVKSVIGEITPPEQRSHHLRDDSASTTPAIKVTSDPSATTSTTTPANTIDNKPKPNSKSKSITELLARTNTAGDFRPVFFLIASRIGIEKPNKVYFSHLHAILQSKFCVGILGGKPKASLYFVAQQGDQVIYLDPHLVQESVNPDNASPRRKVVQTYHCKIPQKMHISAIDPSLAIGFLCTNREEFFEFVAWHDDLQSSGIQTIFTIQPSTPEYLANHTSCKRKSSEVDTFPMEGTGDISSTSNTVNSTPTGKLYASTNKQSRRDSSSSSEDFS